MVGGKSAQDVQLLFSGKTTGTTNKIRTTVTKANLVIVLPSCCNTCFNKSERPMAARIIIA